MATKRFPGSNLHLPGRKPGTMDGYKNLRTTVVHTEGVYRPRQNAFAVARYVHARNIGYHYLIGDQQDAVISLYDWDVGSRSCGNDWRRPWKGVNRRGAARLQICWVGYKYKIPTAKRGTRYWDFMQWVNETVGVPSTTPQDWANPTRKWANWEQSGWSGHCHAPGNDHTDGTGTNMNTLWTPDGGGLTDGGCMSEFGRLRRPQDIIIPGGEARYVKWEGQKTGYHPRPGSGSVRLPPGPVTATVDMHCDGQLVLSFMLLERRGSKPVGSTGNHDVLTGSSLVTNMFNMGKKQKLRIRLANKGTRPIKVDRVQLRLAWCK